MKMNAKAFCREQNGKMGKKEQSSFGGGGSVQFCRLESQQLLEEKSESEGRK